MTAEHIKATSVSIATLSKHVDVPRRQRGDDEELLKVIKKNNINKKELNNSRNTMTVFIQNKKNEIMLFNKEVY